MNRLLLLGRLFATCSCAFISSCVMRETPKTPPATKPLHSAADLVGTYVEGGEAYGRNGSTSISRYLIKDTRLYAQEFRVSIPASGSLRFDAMSGSTVKATRLLKEGKDYEIKDGWVVIDSRFYNPGDYVDSGTIGAGSQQSSLRLTPDGRAIVRREQGGSTGLILLIPYASISDNYVVHKRVK